MEIQVTQKEEKPLLRRTNVQARITFSGATPTRKEVQAGVAKALSAQKDLVIITKVANAYGACSAVVSAQVYDDRATLEKLERSASLRKNSFDKPEKDKTAQGTDGGEQ